VILDFSIEVTLSLPIASVLSTSFTFSPTLMLLSLVRAFSSTERVASGWAPAVPDSASCFTVIVLTFGSVATTTAVISFVSLAAEAACCWGCVGGWA